MSPNSGSHDDFVTSVAPLPMNVSLESDATQILTPPHSFEEFATVSLRQEQAVSAINRDVVELVGRQKVALNDVLEENQRLQIRYNNLAGTYDTWSKQVQLQAEKELTRKMARVRDELASKYDEALGQRTQAQMAELLKLKTDLEIKRQQLLIAKEEQVSCIASQLESQRRSHQSLLRMTIACSILILCLIVALACVHTNYRGVLNTNRESLSMVEKLKRQMMENHDYLNGRGFRCGLVKLLKPNLPHEPYS